MILRPFLYDVRKTLLSKTVLILIGMMLLVSLTIIPLSRSNSFTFFQSQVNVAYYYHNGYNFLLGAYNQYGDPVVGANLNLTLSTVPNSTVTNPSRVASLIGTTNSSGLAFFPFNVKYFDYWVSVETSTSSGNFGFGSMIQNNTAQGNVRLLNGQAISTVTNKANASRTDIQVFYAAPFGAKPLNYQVRFRLFSSPSSATT